MSIFHDFIIVEQENSTSILKTNNENIGIVKEIGCGYYSDNGLFIRNIDFIYPQKITDTANILDLIGKRILFTQSMTMDIEGNKVIVVRGRDVIKSWD